MRLSVRTAEAPVALPQFPKVVQEAVPRLTKRYSALALQLPAKAYSSPAPAAQPTRVVEFESCRWIEPGLDVAERRPSRHVDEGAFRRIADAGARGAEEGILGLARCDGSAAFTAHPPVLPLRRRPVRVAFQAEQNFTDRVVEANRAAEKKTVGVEDTGRRTTKGPLAAAQAVAAIDSDIRTAPMGIGAGGIVVGR